MDLYTALSGSFTEEDRQTNLIASLGENIAHAAMYDSFIGYEQTKQELLDTLDDFDNSCIAESYFCMENWDTGMEGVFKDLWFKFVQFIKRIVNHIRVMWDHFVNGNSRSKRYLERMNVELKSGLKPLNWMAFADTTGLIYTPYEFEELLRLCTKIETVLTTIYRKNDFELDSVMDFDTYGITFKDNRLVQKGVQDEYRTPKFEINIQPKTMSYKRAGWSSSVFAGILGKLIAILEFNIEKDFKFIQFQDSMEKLIHRGGSDGSKYDPEKITRLTNAIRSVVAMCNFMSDTINKLSQQMVLGCKALETPIPEARKDVVY